MQMWETKLVQRGELYTLIAEAGGGSTWEVSKVPKNMQFK